MASVQEPGLVRLYRKTPDGNRTQIAQMSVSDSAPAGGAPDAAGASVATPEKRIKINSPVVFVNDDLLLVTFEPSTGGDAIDASDCVWSIPLVTPQGTKTLVNASFANPALSDLTLIANEQVVAGYKIIEGTAQLRGTIYLDIQDDT
jgi:hypothetical protein